MEPNWDYYGLGTQFGEPPANALRKICGLLPSFPIVCEVGSWVGTSACVMAGEIQSKKGVVYCVDKFHSEGEDNPYLWNAMKKAVAGDSVLDRFLHNVDASGFKSMVHPLVMTSEAASVIMQDQVFDFVFLDGDHRYQYISQDIALWLPKVRPGGILGGHDCEYYFKDIPHTFWEGYGYDHVNSLTGEMDCVEHGFVKGLSIFHPGVIRAVYEMFGDKMCVDHTVWHVRVDG